MCRRNTLCDATAHGVCLLLLVFGRVRDAGFGEPLLPQRTRVTPPARAAGRIRTVAAQRQAVLDDAVWLAQELYYLYADHGGRRALLCLAD